MKKLDLEYFRQPLDWLDPDTGAMLVKSAVACLESQGHASGAILEVERDDQHTDVELAWTTNIIPLQRPSLPNDSELTQKGAECVSLSIARELAGFKYFETARIGEGIDFWLKREDTFQLDACLEVSGIRKETTSNQFRHRHEQKKQQALVAGGGSYDIFVSIVEFSTPKSSFKLR